MIPISETLLPDQINLVLQSATSQDAVDEVLSRLLTNARILDFPAFRQAVIDRDAPAIESHGVGVCIAHGRTRAVQSLVIAAGRSNEGIPFPGCPVPVQLIFTIGVPLAVDSEYLRTVGLIARLCNDPETLSKLLEAATNEAFLEVLAAGESRL